MTAMSMGGKDMPADLLKKVNKFFTVTDTKTVLGGSGGKDDTFTTTRLDGSEIDMKDRGNVALGVYKLEGNTLTICNTMGTTRPKSVERPVAGNRSDIWMQFEKVD